MLLDLLLLLIGLRLLKVSEICKNIKETYVLQLLALLIIFLSLKIVVHVLMRKLPERIIALLIFSSFIIII